MKPSPIIQLVVIFFGISSIITAITYFITNGYFIITSFFGNSNYDLGYSVLFVFASRIVMSLIGFILIAQSSSIASYITSKSGYTNELKIKTDTKEILCIFIVFLALGQLVTYVPLFLSELFDLFLSNNRKSDPDSYNPKKKADWVIYFFQIVLPILMIVFCRNLSNYFGKNIDLAASFHTEEIDQIDITKEEN